MEKSVSQGKKTKRGYTHPLSGFLYCADCDGKMKLNYIKRKGEICYHFNCGNHMRLGKSYCFSHHIAAKTLEEIVISDIKEKAKEVTIDEEKVRRQFIERSALCSEREKKTSERELQNKKTRLADLDKLIETAYEDRMKEKLAEEICIGFIEKYSAERKTLQSEIAELEERVKTSKETEVSVDEFISNIKRYIETPELTREMCYELIDKIMVGGHLNISRCPRTIDIVYKVRI